MKRISDLDVLRAFDRLRDGGPAPTMRELGDYLAVSATTVHRHVESLIGRGLMWRQPVKSRSLGLTAAGQTELAG